MLQGIVGTLAHGNVLAAQSKPPVDMTVKNEEWETTEKERIARKAARKEEKKKCWRISSLMQK